MWNDPTLGNCFTFNHEDQTNLKSARRAGRRDGNEIEGNVISSESSGLVMYLRTSQYRKVVGDAVECGSVDRAGKVLTPGQMTSYGHKYYDSCFVME